MAKTKARQSNSSKARGKKLANKGSPTRTPASRYGRRGRNRATAASHRMRQKELEDNLVQQEKQLRARHDQLKKSVEEVKSIRLGFKDLLMSHFMCGFEPIDNFYLRCAQSTTAGDWMTSNVTTPEGPVASENISRKQTMDMEGEHQATSQTTHPADVVQTERRSSTPWTTTQKSPTPGTPTMSEGSEPNSYWQMSTPTQLADRWDSSYITYSTCDPRQAVNASLPSHAQQSCMSLPQCSDVHTYDPVLKVPSIGFGIEAAGTVTGAYTTGLYGYLSSTSFDYSPLFNTFDFPVDTGIGKPGCCSAAMIGQGWSSVFGTSEHEGFDSNFSFLAALANTT